ncbi:MAG TPA: ester cyclase [Gaiellaceae bacterium]
MSPDNNKSIVRRAIEEPWKGNLDIVDELFASDYVGHDPSLPEQLRGPGDVKEFISTYRGAYPDAQVTVETQIAEGDMVATRWTARGTHKGELMGIEPTGKQVSVSGLTLSRVQNGKIVEGFQNWDALGMMKQLDAIPELARV